MLACALLTVGAGAPHAQQPPAEVPRVGLLAWSSCDAAPLVRGLEELGYRPGKTIAFAVMEAEDAQEERAAAALALQQALAALAPPPSRQDKRADPAARPAGQWSPSGAKAGGGGRRSWSRS